MKERKKKINQSKDDKKIGKIFGKVTEQNKGRFKPKYISNCMKYK